MSWPKQCFTVYYEKKKTQFQIEFHGNKNFNFKDVINFPINNS